MTTYRARDLDYLRYLADESARFAAVLSGTAPEARVPTCPDWNADDLLWHLGEVQWFWGHVVADGVLTTEQADKVRAERPPTRADLTAFFEESSRRLGEALAGTNPDAAAWTWADDKTVGFIRRRQAHEALIHRLDAELTAGHRTAMDAILSADGVDEALRIMYGGDLPEWGRFEPTGQAVEVSAIDTGDSWHVALGQFTGTDPDDGQEYGQLGIQIVATAPGDSATEPGDSAAATAVIAGNAADLDCWLWSRPGLGSLDRSGDAGAIGAFESIIDRGIS
jgi:uncharacterized protein (TIGR03083 family)